MLIKEFLTFNSCHSRCLLGDTLLVYLAAIMPHVSLIFTRLTPKFETQIDILRWRFQWNQERCSKCHSITTANIILTTWLHGRVHSVSAIMPFIFDFTGQNYIKNWVVSFPYIICNFWVYRSIEYEVFGILECDDLCCGIYTSKKQLKYWDGCIISRRTTGMYIFAILHGLPSRKSVI